MNDLFKNLPLCEIWSIIIFVCDFAATKNIINWNVKILRKAWKNFHSAKLQLQDYFTQVREIVLLNPNCVAILQPNFIEGNLNTVEEAMFNVSRANLPLCMDTEPH